MSMKCKKVLAVSVIFSLFMANIAYAANPKVEIAYRGSVEDGLEIEYDDGTVKYADDNAMLMMINGDLISNANIIIKNGTTLVPLRIISEQLKAKEAEGFVESKFGGSLKNFLVAFRGSDKISKKDMNDLKAWLDELDD